MTPATTSAAPRRGRIDTANVARVWRLTERGLDALQAPALLAARLYVASVFFNSGLQSLRDWAATVWLYTNEFHVAPLPPYLAALVGTAGELLLPPLVAFGLFGRFGALGLFVVNAVALASYLYALQAPAILFHVIWGGLMLLVALWGPGRWSLDAWRAARRCGGCSAAGPRPTPMRLQRTRWSKAASCAASCGAPRNICARPDLSRQTISGNAK
jgi:putative oxidoreductase